jgi:hypothetical protein
MTMNAKWYQIMRERIRVRVISRRSVLREVRRIPARRGADPDSLPRGIVAAVMPQVSNGIRCGALLPKLNAEGPAACRP